jgi:hypothetical protein
MNELNININGNKKLQNNEKIRYMIWNLPAVKTCPFSTELCRNSCYARKAEKQYKPVLPCRENNYNETLKADFVSNMIFTIEKHLNSKAFKNKLAIFRIHESGDFYSLEYVEKWLLIAKHFENDRRIKFLAYTKSIIYFINSGYGLLGFPKNLVVRSSLWNDTQIDKIELTKAYNFPIYTALFETEINEQKSNGRYFSFCRCDNCSTCRKCWNNNIKNIVVKIH